MIAHGLFRSLCFVLRQDFFWLGPEKHIDGVSLGVAGSAGVGLDFQLCLTTVLKVSFGDSLKYAAPKARLFLPAEKKHKVDTHTHTQREREREREPPLR